MARVPEVVVVNDNFQLADEDSRFDVLIDFAKAESVPVYVRYSKHADSEGRVLVAVIVAHEHEGHVFVGSAWMPKEEAARLKRDIRNDVPVPEALKASWDFAVAVVKTMMP